MFSFFANIFGYLLNFIYHFVNNYGLAMILFTLVIKILMLPLSIKQQRMLKKSNKMQEKLKVLQFKYKNNPEKLNQEMMNLYKEEKMNPFGGCLSSIVQFILLISIFYMVRSPLTYMKKMDTEVLNTYVQQLKDDGKTISAAYPEIDLLRESTYLAENNPEDENAKNLALNMNFLGLDLSKIPQQNLSDWTVYIIPVLYILSSFVSIKINSNMQSKAKGEKSDVIDVTENKKDKEKAEKESESKDLVKVENEEEEFDAMAQTNKMMSWMVPIMSVSISLVAPLGLALYWLVNNITNILERLILNKVIKDD